MARRTEYEIIIDEIKAAEAKVQKAKDEYAAANEELDAANKKLETYQANKIVKAIKASKHSFDDILQYIVSAPKKEQEES